MIKLAIGVQRKTGILDNGFSGRILQKYRRKSAYAYQGASLTYLNHTVSNRREIITKHPVFVTLQLMNQKLYLEQDTSILVNKRIYQEMVENQLASTMEIIRTQYQTLYPEFRFLHEKVELLKTSDKSKELQKLLSIQMKRLQGDSMSEWSEEERAVLERLEKIQEDSNELGKEQIWDRRSVLEQTRKLETEEIWEHLSEVEKESIQKQIAELDIEEILRQINTTGIESVEEHRVPAVNVPTLWEKYQEAVRIWQTQQKENSSTEIDDRLLVFLNTLQEGNQEERIEFKKFLNSDVSFIGQKTGQGESLSVLLERNPKKLLQILEQWNETKETLSEQTRKLETEEIWEHLSEVEKESIRKQIAELDIEKILRQINTTGIESVEEHRVPAVNVPTLWEKYQEAVRVWQTQQKENSSTEIDDRLFVFLNTLQEGNQEERIEFKKFLNSAILFKEQKKGQEENLSVLLEQNPKKLLQILEQWNETKETLSEQTRKLETEEIWEHLSEVEKESIRKQIAELDIEKILRQINTTGTESVEEHRVQTVNVPTLWEKYQEAVRIWQTQQKENSSTEIDDRLFVFLNTLQEGSREERVEFKKLLQILEQRNETTGNSVLKKKEVQREWKEKMAAEEITDKKWELYRFFISPEWKKIIERPLFTDSMKTGNTGDIWNEGNRCYTSVEISRQKLYETERKRISLIGYLEKLPETQYMQLIQGYTELVLHKNNTTAAKNVIAEYAEKTVHNHEAARNREIEWIRHLSGRDLEEIYQYVWTYASLEEKERLTLSAAPLQMEEERMLTVRGMEIWNVSAQEILERPYSYVHRKRQLTELIQHGTIQEVSQVFHYMKMHRMVDRTMSVQHPEGIRSQLCQHIQKLTEEQITLIVEDIVQVIRENAEIRRMERTEEHDMEKQLLKQKQVFQRTEEEHRVLQMENEIVYKNTEKTQQETRYVEHVLEKYKIQEKEETKILKRNQEKSVQMLTEQTEELQKLKRVIEKQALDMEEMKKNQTPVMNRNQLYQDMMKRMERQLHLERQRRGMD